MNTNRRRPTPHNRTFTLPHRRPNRSKRRKGSTEHRNRRRTRNRRTNSRRHFTTPHNGPLSRPQVVNRRRPTLKDHDKTHKLQNPIKATDNNILLKDVQRRHTVHVRPSTLQHMTSTILLTALPVRNSKLTQVLRAYDSLFTVSLALSRVQIFVNLTLKRNRQGTPALHLNNRNTTVRMVTINSTPMRTRCTVLILTSNRNRNILELGKPISHLNRNPYHRRSYSRRQRHHRRNRTRQFHRRTS